MNIYGYTHMTLSEKNSAIVNLKKKIYFEREMKEAIFGKKKC